MNTPKIQTVQPLEGQRLLVKFDNEVEKIYDCQPLLQHDVFRPLASEAFFRMVKVDVGGYGISWNDDIDLSEYELWVNGKEVPVVAEAQRA